MLASMPDQDPELAWQNSMSGNVTGPDIPDTRVNAVRMGELGVFGTPIFGGLISEDFNARFADLKQAVGIYDEMRRTDGTVQATLLAMELPILQAEWYVEAASQDEEDIRIAKTLAWNLFEGMTVSFRDVLRQGLGMHWAGFSLFEKVFEQKEFEGEQFIGLRKLAQRLATTVSRWDFDDNGGPKGVFQQAPTSTNEVYIPIWKALLFTNRKEGGNVQGMSFLRPAYKHFYIKDKLYRLQAIGFERDVVGVPVIKLPRGSNKNDKAKAEEIVKSLRRDENAGAVISETWNLSLLQGLNTGGKESSIIEMIRHHDMKITQAMLAQMINMGEGSRGAYALAVPMSDIMTLAQMAQADYIEETFNNYVLRQLVDFNWPGRRVPKLKHGDIRKKDLRAMSLIFNALTTSGLLDTSPEILDYVRQFFGLPERDTAFDIPRDAAAPAGPNPETTDAPPNPPADGNIAPDALEKDMARFTGTGRERFVYNDAKGALAALRSAENILARSKLQAQLEADANSASQYNEGFGNGVFDGAAVR